MSKFREKVADLCHRQWSGWMEYLFSKCYPEVGLSNEYTGNLVIPESFVNRWKRQVNTEYKDLSDAEKDSDRKEADKFIDLFRKGRNG